MEGVMKALSLTQPWASLVAIGAKRIETRSWRTSYRGEVAIHAAKGLGPVGGMSGLTDQCAAAHFFEALAAHADTRGWAFRSLTSMKGHPMMPLGAVVAIAQLVHVMGTEYPAAGWGAKVFRRPEPGTPERAFGDYSPRRYMWFLENVRPLREPIPCRGALSLWDVPEEAAAAVREQLKRAA